MAFHATIKAPSTFEAKPSHTIHIYGRLYVDISSKKQFIQDLLPFVISACSSFSSYLDDDRLDEIAFDAMCSLWESKEELKKERPGALIVRTIIQKTFDYLRNIGKYDVVDEIIKTLNKMQ